MDHLTLDAARTRYYEVNHFGADGGDALAWVPIKVLGVTFKIPNTDGRRRAVRYHDLHHIVTGYATDLRGEGEIGAWELATGCTSSAAATVLNLLALGIGFLLAPHRMARAWARGRATQNLYGEAGIDHLLPRRVDDVRRALHLDVPALRVRVRDALAVTALAVPVLVVLAAPLAGVAALVFATAG